MLSVAVGLRPAWQTGLITDTVRLAGVPSLGQRYACPSRRWRRRSFTCSLAVILSQLAGTLYQYLTIRAAILTCSQADISQKKKNQKVQKAQLSPRDRATRRVSWNRATLNCIWYVPQQANDLQGHPRSPKMARIDRIMILSISVHPAPFLIIPHLRCMWLALGGAVTLNNFSVSENSCDERPHIFSNTVYTQRS